MLREALAIDNTAEVPIDGSHTSQAISLNFPKFTDGRAYSQAALLRGRLGLQALLSRPAMYWLTRFCKWLDVVSAMPFASGSIAGGGTAPIGSIQSLLPGRCLSDRSPAAPGD